MAIEKTLDTKLACFANGEGRGGFILADAKDADMAFGLAAPGRVPQPDGRGRLRSIDEFREQAREVVRQGLIDIMLMSVSTSDILTGEERLFEESGVTPAIRANDTTDIWLAGTDAAYARHPSLPFRTANLDETMGRSLGAGPTRPGANLGLYSITLNNDARLDRETLAAYAAFRVEASAKGFRHFLEVFPPNALTSPLADVGRFVVDSIVRTLAGVSRASRPVFLKVPYFGPAPTEALACYDPSLVIGVLGGGSGTTRDAMQLVSDAKRHGARAALFGRKINAAEHQPSFVAALRAVADGQLEPDEAVRRYHGDLQARGVAPCRSLEDDLRVSESALAYSG